MSTGHCPVSGVFSFYAYTYTCDFELLGFRKIWFLPFLKEQKVNIRGAIIKISLIPVVLNLICIWRTQCTMLLLLLFQICGNEFGNWKIYKNKMEIHRRNKRFLFDAILFLAYIRIKIYSITLPNKNWTKCLNCNFYSMNNTNNKSVHFHMRSILRFK